MGGVAQQGGASDAPVRQRGPVVDVVAEDDRFVRRLDQLLDRRMPAAEEVEEAALAPRGGSPWPSGTLCVAYQYALPPLIPHCPNRYPRPQDSPGVSRRISKGAIARQVVYPA